jgi:hypothetical protein
MEGIENVHLLKLADANFALNESKFCSTAQKKSPGERAEIADLDLHSLLVEAGATAPRRERGRWNCPVCGKRSRVAVDFSRGLFQCWTAGCTFHGSVRSLAGRLGHKTDSPEWREKAAIARRRRELKERVRLLRRERFEAVTGEFWEKMREYEQLRGGVRHNIDQADLLERGLSTYSELLGLNAEMLLVEVLPDLELCEFLGAPERSRQTQIAEVVSQDAVFANGRFFELPPVRSRHSVADVPGVPMPDGWIPGTAKGRRA